LCEQDDRRRVEVLDDGLLAIISDLTFEPNSDPAEVSPLWWHLSKRLIVTGRIHPLKTIDELRSTIRGGARLLQAKSTLLDEEQTESMRTEIDELSGRARIAGRGEYSSQPLCARDLSAVFLPMTLITGIFGMNVAGLPGLHSYGAFWWVMLLIGLAGAVTLGAIFWRRP
jgi:Mg2+ and Co2+ transporter CorA